MSLNSMRSELLSSGFAPSGWSQRNAKVCGTSTISTTSRTVACWLVARSVKKRARAARPHVDLCRITEPFDDLGRLGYHAPHGLHWCLDKDVALDHIRDHAIALLAYAQPMVAFPSRWQQA